jgi:renalase
MPSIAIIGSGCSGLAAAHQLIDMGHTVTIFEQNQQVGGRAATGKQQGFIYDYGAQYIKHGDSVSVKMISERFRLAELIDIAKPVWIFDGDGHVQEGDPILNAEPKWNYRSGLQALPERMAESLDIRLQTYIDHVKRGLTSWKLFDKRGKDFGEFDRILITIPANEAGELINKSEIENKRKEVIRASLEKARYNPIISVMLGYRPVPQERPYYALVNTDKAHAISWLAWEHEKASERTPKGAGMLIAQMAPHYSHEYSLKPDAEIVSDVAHRVASLLDEPLDSPFFTDVFRWRYALPAEMVDADQLNALAKPLGLAFCGDAFVGGRVHLALEHGFEFAQQLMS